VLFLVACSPEPDEIVVSSTPAPAAPAPMKIMLLTKSQSNPYYVMMEQGAREAAEQLGVNLVAKGTPNETHVALQKKILLSAKEEGFDAIVFVPSKTAQLLPTIKQVQDQGVILVNLDDKIDPVQAEKVGLSPIPFVGIHNQEAARTLANSVLQGHPEIKTAYIILGPQSSSVSEARAAGYRQALIAQQRHILGEASANWQYVEAFELSDKLLQQHPNIDAFFCANDVMAIAISKLLEDRGRNDIEVIGYDAIPEAKALVEQGKLAATLDQQSGQQGAQGVRTAVALLKGEKVEADSWVTPELVTKPQ